MHGSVVDGPAVTDLRHLDDAIGATLRCMSATEWVTREAVHAAHLKGAAWRGGGDEEYYQGILEAGLPLFQVPARLMAEVEQQIDQLIAATDQERDGLRAQLITTVAELICG